MRDPKERLRDILDAIAAIERYRDREKADFEADEFAPDAAETRRIKLISRTWASGR